VADAVAEFRPFLREVTPLDENDATSDAGSPSSPDHAALLAVATLELRAGTDEGPAASGDPAALQARAAAVVYAARALAAGELVGWHQGRAEFGPRALGARSLLADPRNATLAQLLNSQVKKREAFRPFAPAVLAEEADKWFMDLTVNKKENYRQTVALEERRYRCLCLKKNKYL
jgi:carbamoyltransferase